jgi:hypothetical protein
MAYVHRIPRCIGRAGTYVDNVSRTSTYVEYIGT